MSFDSDRFIGIVHKTNGDTFESCDCLGLVRLFYKEHGWTLDFWDGGEPITNETAHSKKAWDRLYRYLNKNMKRVKKPDQLEYGAVVLFNIDGDMHMGLYVGDGMLLAMAVPCKEGVTKSVLYHRRVWSVAYKRGYNRAKPSSKDGRGQELG